MPLPRARRRVVYRDRAYSAVHRFRHAAAHLEAFRTGWQWHVDQLMPRTAPVPREAVVRCAPTLAEAVAQAVVRLDGRAVPAPDATDDTLRAYAAAGWDVVDPVTGRTMAWARRPVAGPYPWQSAEHEGLVPVNSSRSAGAALDVRETAQSRTLGPLGPVVVPCSGAKSATETTLPVRQLYTELSPPVPPGGRAPRRHRRRRRRSLREERLRRPRRTALPVRTPHGPARLRRARDARRPGQAARILPGPRPVVALGGCVYVPQLRPDALQPLAGCRGIGEQRARLARLIRSEQPLDVLHQLTTAAAPTA
ncbi:hypothetical protein [Streptomyces sp. CB02009]|uniref:hypothetical protein n=1 Tax=Streptomyces sp. CB02009 TaxID=1703938 RepID=UPI0011610E85|nr:hypothetical protein [Streptomyces sp. CB02009]